jgi:hypothetical protein
MTSYLRLIDDVIKSCCSGLIERRLFCSHVPLFAICILELVFVFSNPKRRIIRPRWSMSNAGIVGRIRYVGNCMR